MRNYTQSTMFSLSSLLESRHGVVHLRTVIKKGRCHGARHGKTQEQTEYNTAWNAWKRCCKRVDSHGEHFKGIHDRSLRLDRAKVHERKIDELAKENHLYHLFAEEFKGYQGQWYLTLNKSGKNAPMGLRPDFRAAASLKNRLHRESGEEIAEPISLQQCRKAIPGGARPRVGGTHDKITSDLFLLQFVSFAVDGDPLYRRGV